MREFDPGYLRAPYRVPVALVAFASDFPAETGSTVDDFRVECATVVIPTPPSERPS